MAEQQFLLWIFLYVGLVGSFLLLSFRTTPQLAIGIAVGCSLIVPTWILIPLFETPGGTIVASGVDVKLAVAVSCLILYCFMPKRTFPVQLVPLDFAMIGIVIVHFISDVSNSGFSWIIIARMYAEWFVPYVAGRIAFQTLVIPDSLWKVFAVVSVTVGVFAIIESVSKVNLFELVAGERPEDGFPRDQTRMGLLRAYGPTMHPIFFGGLQLLLFAWPAYGASQALRGKVHYGWVFLPIIPVLGIFVTGSRAPIIGIVVLVVALIFFLIQKARVPVVVMTALVAIMASLNFYWIIERLEEWADESRGAQYSRLSVDGQMKTATGTRSRLFTLEMYRIAITRSGLLGFGTAATSGFPVNVPLGGQDVKTLKRFKYIDNTYVLLALRFGYAGIACFVAACLASLGQFYWLCTTTTPKNVRLLSGFLASSLLAFYFVAWTVWMPYDIGFPLLWTMGISSGLFRAYLTPGSSKGKAIRK